MVKQFFPNNVLLRILLMVAVVRSQERSQPNSFNWTLMLPDLPTAQTAPQACSAIRAPLPPTGKDWFVTGLKPLGNTQKMHHFGFFVCSGPGYMDSHYKYEVPTSETQTLTTGPFWSCLDEPIPGLHKGPYCPYHEMKRIYNWDAVHEEYHFPDDMGFRVGYDLASYLVFSLHYLSTPDEEDHLGMEVYFKDAVSSQIGVIDTWTPHFSIAPNSTKFVDCVMKIEDQREFNVYGFNPHTHALGRMISAYRVRQKEWTFIGKSAPRLPIDVHPVEGGDVIVLRQGDFVAFRCILVNDGDHPVTKGAKAEDEMCMLNLYFKQDNATYWIPQHSCITDREVWKQIGMLMFPPEASVI